MKYQDIINGLQARGRANKLKPIICEHCKMDGCNMVGVCPKCLENQAYNIEWLETHSFVYDDCMRGYHNDCHNDIKGLPLRLPNEHPLLFYGCEVEIGFADEVEEVEYDDCDEECDRWTAGWFERVLSEASKIAEGLFVYEQDSTVDRGVEFISRPCSYAYWTHPDTVKKLEKMFEYLRSEGALIKQPDGHGLHIHLSKKFFENSEHTRNRYEQVYANFDWLFNYYQPELEKLGRRKYTEWCGSKADKLKADLMSQICNNGFDSIGSKIKCSVKKSKYHTIPTDNHRYAINSDRNTIEVRTFKSTTDYKELLASIEIVRAVAHAVREEDIKKSLDDILHTKDTVFLDEYIQKIKMECARNKDPLTLDRVNTDEMEVVVE